MLLVLVVLFGFIGFKSLPIIHPEGMDTAQTAMGAAESHAALAGFTNHFG